MNTNAHPVLTEEEKSRGIVLVTSSFISFVKAIQSFHAAFTEEDNMARDLNMPLPTQNALERAHHYFSWMFSRQADAIGIKQNRITFQNILHLQFSDEVMNTNCDELPKRYKFDPWLGQGKGGIYAYQEAASDL